MNDTLMNVLAAREQRWNTRLALVHQTNRCLITVTLCIPVAFRTDEKINPLFESLCIRLKELLDESGVQTELVEKLNGADGPAIMLTTTTDAEETKNVCVQAEEKIPGGRMLDIDVMDAKGNPISRSDLGLAPRRCFLCDNPAAVCIAGKRHAPDDISTFVISLLELAGSQA